MHSPHRRCRRAVWTLRCEARYFPRVYQPAHFREDRREVQFDLIHRNPLGTLISHGIAGLIANPLPFVLYDGEGASGTLRVHMARANPQWQQLDGTAECLVVFAGSNEYITPSWLPTKQQTGKVVPTWNYATVHVWGTPRVTHDAGWLMRQITDLTAIQESKRPEPWQVTDAPAEYVEKLVAAIVGIEIPIERIEGKWKVSQNRNEAERTGIVAGLEGQGSEVMAKLVRGPDPL